MRPFRIDVPAADVHDLRHRLENTRWPGAATTTSATTSASSPDLSQGLPLELVQDLCDEWAHGYDWLATQARLNEIPQITVRIDGLNIHALHVRSPRVDATPLILTHGWPGSFLEFEDVLKPLTHGDPAFHVVVPSLPGYGFSDQPSEPGWGVRRIARAWVQLMTSLQYGRFVAAGSDWGTSISTCIGLQHPQRLLGLHLVPPLAAPPVGQEPTVAEAAALDELAERSRDASAYSEVHRTRPQTIGYALTDSPAALAAWIGEKLLTWTDGTEALSRRQILDNLSLYWFTRTGASSARLYTESIAEVGSWFTDADAIEPVNVPTAATIFPREVPRPSRRWVEHRFPHLVHWGEPLRGGHFGAWEQPELFAAELRTGLRALREI